ncbi:endolytic transglycosylase MltG [Cardinium endosymbiont of Oedothorax gibbosus]|uniref:endolytic transglycosylase MltG n=1 Tax=Cardinium endosymbiont of Oedothorax gibbosus TaxID=931101 RepID=UPI002024ACFA|nr:endolytic transglycosylase MltG [Cardinium endosymbiont of Oedothorax gibbosus]CAH2559774.1 Endolytic murein transglycosylase [Cardinium endosymbiont of Oedothorax gibbosus]
MVDLTSIYTAFFFKKRMQWMVAITFLICVTLYAILGLPNVHATSCLLLIPRGCTRYQLKEQLKNEGYIRNGAAFLWAVYLLKYHPKNTPGQYRLMGNITNWQLIRMLRGGMQHPVKLTFSTAANTTSLVDQLISRIGVNKEALCNLLHDAKKLSSYGFTPENVLTMFIPDTYEVYWTITAEQLLSKMHLAYQRFWNTTRMHKAKKIQLSPIDVSILASIVQAETNDPQEAAMIAGVYLNRLKRNMPLQSCPMLIYALREKQLLINRVLQQDTYIDSPYNSYRKKGLPPGPIGLPSVAMIDAVLNYVPHDYLFFSAKEDFSGLHYFARHYSAHLKNAYKYRKALDRLQIMH